MELGKLRSLYDDTVCVNAAVESNVLDYNVAVRCPTSAYGDASYTSVRRRVVRSVNGALVQLYTVCVKINNSLCYSLMQWRPSPSTSKF